MMTLTVLGLALGITLIFSPAELSYLGAALLLAAYGLIGKMGQKELDIANVLGALFLTIGAVVTHGWAFAILNTFWLIIGLKNMFRKV
jgi:hypothetical protein